MNRLSQRILTIPLIILHTLNLIAICEALNVEYKVWILILYVCLGVCLFLLRIVLFNFTKIKKYKIDSLYSALAIVIFISTFFYYFKALIPPLIKSFNTGDILPFAKVISELVSTVYLSPIVYALSFISTLLFEGIFIRQESGLLCLFGISYTALYLIMYKTITSVHVLIIILMLFVSVFRCCFGVNSNIKIKKFILISIVSIAISIGSYFLSYYFIDVDVRVLFDKAIDRIGEVLNISKKELMANNTDIVLKEGREAYSFIIDNKTEDINNKTIMVIRSDYYLDRIKTYSLDYYDNGVFKINEQREFVDTSDYFIKSVGTPEPAKFEVEVFNDNNNFVYVPYGEVSFNTKAYLYNDLFYQFNKLEDYDCYELYYNPNVYSSELKDILVAENTYSLSHYSNYARKNYAIIDKQSQYYKAIDAVLKEYTSSDSYIEFYKENYDGSKDKHVIDRFAVNVVNEYLRNNIELVKEYETSEEMDDISYCLTNTKAANPRLLAAIAVEMYRYYGIPSRFVVGYRINNNTDGLSTIYDSDLTYWAEVYIDGSWIASDRLGYSVSDDSNGGEILDKINTKDKEADVILKVKTDYPIDRLKRESYGDYDVNRHEFLLEENIDSIKGIKRATSIYDMDTYFNEMFIDNRALPYHITITNYANSTNVYTPYGVINIKNVTLYQDKKLSFIDKTKEYALSFVPYSNTLNFKAKPFYDDYVYEKYLNVPIEFRKDLEDFLLSHNIDYNDSDKTLLVKKIRNTLMSDEFNYNLDVEIPVGKDPIMYFLLEGKEGVCEHYAGAAVLLFRVCGIPSRYTTGFSLDSNIGEIEVTSKDAHAWPEVYTANLGWNFVEVTGSEHFIVEYIEADDLDAIRIENKATSSRNDPSSIDEISSTAEINNLPISLVNLDALDFLDAEIMKITGTNNLNRIKAYSCGSYNFEKHGFEIVEDIEELSSIKNIKKQYSYNDFFITVLNSNTINDGNLITVTNYSAANWVYVPYGCIDVPNAELYQDKYFYFKEDNKENYLEYSLIQKDYDDNTLYKNSSSYEAFVYENYLDVPYDMKATLIKVLEDAGIDYNSENKTKLVEQIQDFLINNYSFSTSSIFVPKDKDPVLYFLDSYHSGNYTHFASSATLLYRICGIPARYVCGYYLGEGETQEYIVKYDNYHAWCEVYTSNHGWDYVETCKNYIGKDINDYEFKRNADSQDYTFEDIERTHTIRGILSFVEITSVCVIIILFIINNVKKIRKKRAIYKEKLLSMGIDSKEKLQLLKDINRTYYRLERNGYVDKDVKETMERIRFSNKQETIEDLNRLNEKVLFMKEDIRKKRRGFFLSISNVFKKKK